MTTTALSNTPNLRRQYDPTPDVFDSLYRFYAAEILGDERNMRESVNHLSLISYLQMLADAESSGFRNGSAR
jgi:hypothetical protein